MADVLSYANLPEISHRSFASMVFSYHFGMVSDPFREPVLASVMTAASPDNPTPGIRAGPAPFA